MNTVIPIGAPSAAEKLRRLLLTVERIHSGLRFVTDCDWAHGVIHLAELETEAAAVQGIVASFDRPGALAAIEAALRPASRQQIAETAAALVGCFPFTGKYDLTVFGTVLPREIGDREPCVGALELAFKTVVARSRVLAIPEVLAAVEAAQAALAAAAEQIPKWDDETARMQTRLEKLRERAQWHRAQSEKRRQA